ncbi:MAG: toprim domain-containing protein [Rikenellaceae bacterium]
MRAVDLEIAQKYCREVHYTLNGKRRFAVGFQSDAGGWEFSSRGFKISSSPKAPTIIKGSSDSTLLFEGFMDMLAYLTLKNAANPVDSVCVLNSVSNLNQAVEFLKSQRKIYAFLDNDTAGRKALSAVEKLGVEVVDCSHIYAEHKDMNDYLIAQNRGLRSMGINVGF